MLCKHQLLDVKNGIDCIAVHVKRVASKRLCLERKELAKDSDVARRLKHSRIDCRSRWLLCIHRAKLNCRRQRCVVFQTIVSTAISNSRWC